MRHNLLIGAAVIVGFFVISGEWYLLARPMPQAEGPMSSSVRTSPAQSQRPSSPTPVVAKPAATITPTVGIPGASPSLITMNTPTMVTVTVQISPTPIANGVNLLRLAATGTQPTILGVMHDDGLNGDAVANNGIYTLLVPFNEGAAGQIQLEVSAAFSGRLTRTLSSQTQLTVLGILSDSVTGFTTLYQPGLFNMTTTNTPVGVFTLESSPNGVDIGGGGPEDNSAPSKSGFEIAIQGDQFTALPFNVHQWLADEYPLTQIATLTPISIGGQPGYEIEFANEVGAGQPLAVVCYQGYVYRISYASTFPASSPADSIGLNALAFVLQHFTFTR